MNIYLKGKVAEHFTQSEYNMDESTTAYITADSIIFIVCLEEFRKWLKKPMYVTSWYRADAVNKKVGGISTSNHLSGCAMDWYAKGIDYRAKFIPYVKKWNEICRKHGKIPEAGLYTWGFHFGIQNETQAALNRNKLVHWDSRTGTQINNPFRELNQL